MSKTNSLEEFLKYLKKNEPLFIKDFPQIDFTNKTFGELSQIEKAEVLRKALSLENPYCWTKSFLPEMGLDHPKDLPKILPLMEFTKDSSFVNEVIQNGWVHKNFESEFGSISGMEIVSRSLIGRPLDDSTSPHPSYDVPTQFRNLFDDEFLEALSHPDREGKTILQKEREHAQKIIKAGKFKLEQTLLPLNWHAQKELSWGDATTYDGDSYKPIETKIKDIRQNLLDCIKYYPHEIKRMAQALLFDFDKNGDKRPALFFEKSFWTDLRNWTTQIDVLAKKQILDPTEILQIIGVILNEKECEMPRDKRTHLKIIQKTIEHIEASPHFSPSLIKQEVDKGNFPQWGLNFFSNPSKIKNDSRKITP